MTAQLDLFAPDLSRPGERIYAESSIVWRGIPVQIRYAREWLGPWFNALMGYGVAHLEVSAAIALPITETGFISRFDRPENIGNPVDFVRDWLDAESEPKRRKRRSEAAA